MNQQMFQFSDPSSMTAKVDFVALNEAIRSQDFNETNPLLEEEGTARDADEISLFQSRTPGDNVKTQVSIDASVGNPSNKIEDDQIHDEEFGATAFPSEDFDVTRSKEMESESREALLVAFGDLLEKLGTRYNFAVSSVFFDEKCVVAKTLPGNSPVLIDKETQVEGKTDPKVLPSVSYSSPIAGSSKTAVPAPTPRIAQPAPQPVRSIEPPAPVSKMNPHLLPVTASFRQIGGGSNLVVNIPTSYLSVWLLETQTSYPLNDEMRNELLWSYLQSQKVVKQVQSRFYWRDPVIQ